MPSNDSLLYGAFPLEFSSGNLKNSASVAFSAPYANGIRAISPEQLTLPVMPPYYGDKINLLFWNLLGVPFGAVPNPSNPLTLQDGYTYIYNHIRHTFSVYDEVSNRIIYKTDIKDIAQLDIDFTIMNSHQFLVIADPDDLGGSRFIFDPSLDRTIWKATYSKLHTLNNIYSVIFTKPAVTDLRVFDPKILYSMIMTHTNSIVDRIPDIIGINNSDIADRIRPYLENDIDNPSWHSPFYIKDIYKFIVYEYNVYNYYFGGYSLGDLHSVYKADINWDKNCPTNYLYDDIDLVFEFVKVFDIMNGLYINLHYLLPELSENMFPRRLPIQRFGEVNNGRPLYEPWLIYSTLWGSWLEFDITNYPPGTTIDNKDTYEVEVFDLSPLWG